MATASWGQGCLCSAVGIDMLIMTHQVICSLVSNTNGNHRLFFQQTMPLRAQTIWHEAGLVRIGWFQDHENILGNALLVCLESNKSRKSVYLSLKTPNIIKQCSGCPLWHYQRAGDFQLYLRPNCEFLGLCSAVIFGFRSFRDFSALFSDYVQKGLQGPFNVLFSFFTMVQFFPCLFSHIK